MEPVLLPLPDVTIAPEMFGDGDAPSPGTASLADPGVTGSPVEFQGAVQVAPGQSDANGIPSEGISDL